MSLKIENSRRVAKSRPVSGLYGPLTLRLCMRMLVKIQIVISSA